MLLFLEKKKVMISNISIKSSAFAATEEIPVRYTCDGEDVNPPLELDNLPQGTKSLVLIVEDPDAPAGIWDHWIVWTISPVTHIAEDSVPGTEGKNSFGKHHYGGPCPPSGTHRYFFKVFALNDRLELDVSSEREEVEAAMVGKILGKGELMGTYNRKR